MKQPNVTVYGSQTCGDTLRVRAYLDLHQIPYEYKDVSDDPSYDDYIAALNGGKRVLPTLRIDNQTLINPSDQELESVLAQATEAR
ncbi:MAG: glutaredoxin-like protein [Planctomycetota bacterium]|nr:glutaredoxin-like protein [Planctomycetota bacterium]